MEDANNILRGILTSVEERLRKLPGHCTFIDPEMLAVRHGEDARMRIEKILQYALGNC